MGQVIKPYHIKNFKKNGYILFKNLINKKDISTIKQNLKTMAKEQNNGRGLAEPGVKKSLIHSLHKSRSLKKVVETKQWFNHIPMKLLNTKKIFVWNAKSNLKRKFHGSCEYYHQDFIYWKDFGFKSDNMLNCMIFVDDHSHLNGGLWVFPKSHLKLFKHESFLNINSLQKYHVPINILEKLNKKNPAIPIEAKAGSVLFFHSRLIHGSAHNISSKERRILLYDISSSENIIDQKNKKISSFNRKERIKFEKSVLIRRLKSLSV
tara:strand:- start:3292 stop:4083 length:792 start_codon:yes stop_codon:yes gene_type:complete